LANPGQYYGPLRGRQQPRVTEHLAKEVLIAGGLGVIAVPVSIAVGVSVAVSVGVPVAVRKTVTIAVPVGRFPKSERGKALVGTPVVTAASLALQQDRQVDMQRNGNPLQRAETGQDATVLDTGDVGARQMRRRSQLFLGQAPEAPPTAHASGNVGMTLRFRDRGRWRRLHFKRVVAATAPVAGGFKLNQAAAVTAKNRPGIPRDGGRDRWSWNGCNAYGCW